MTTAALLALALMLVAAPAQAVTGNTYRWPGFKPLLSDTSSTGIRVPSSAKPIGYMQAMLDTMYGVTYRRVSPDSGAILINGNRAGADFRNRYSKIPVTSTDGTLGYMENKTGTNSGDCVTLGGVNGGTSGTHVWVDGNTFQQIRPGLDMNARRLTNDFRWHPHPLYPDDIFSTYSNSGNTVNAFIRVNVRTGVTQDSIPLAWEASFLSEGNGSYDGRWHVVVKEGSEDDAQPHTIQIVDAYLKTAWDEIVLPADINAYSDADRIGHIDISPTGKYLWLKYADTPELLRVFEIDTTAKTVTPVTMTPGALRCCGPRGPDNLSGTADDDLEGWGYNMSHPDATVDEHGDDWIIGGDRCGTGFTGADCDVVPSGARPSTFGADSGKVVAMRMKDGVVRRLSIGRRFAASGFTEEAGVQHVSCRNVHRPGWAYVSFDVRVSSSIDQPSTRQYVAEMTAWRLDTTGFNRRVQRLGHLHSLSFGDAPHLWECYRSEPQLSPSFDGRVVVWPAAWRYRVDTLAVKAAGMWTWRKGYMVDISDTTTFYVRGRGSDLHGDGTFARPFRTVAKVNCVLRPGDTADIDSLNAADTSNALLNRIYPKRSGLPGKYITYRGNVGSPHTIPIPAMVLERRFISVRGFRVKSHVKFAHVDSSSVLKVPAVPADWDSVSWCQIAANSDTSIPRGVTFEGVLGSVLYGNLIYGPIKVMGASGTATACSTAFCVRPSEQLRIRRNTIKTGTIAPLDGKAFWSRRGVWFTGKPRSCLMDSNRVEARMDTTGLVGGGGPQTTGLLHISNALFCQWTDNRWIDTTATPNIRPDQWKAFALWDTTEFCQFVRDTMEVDPENMYTENLAHYDMAGPGSRGRANSWVRITSRLNGSAALWSTTLRAASIDTCVFISGVGNGVQANGATSGCRIRRSTFKAYRAEAALWSGEITSSNMTRNLYWREATTADSCVVRFNNVPNSWMFSHNFNLFYSPTDSACHAVQYHGRNSSVGMRCGISDDCVATDCWWDPNKRDFDSFSSWGNPSFISTDMTTTYGDVDCNPGTVGIDPDGGYVGGRDPFNVSRPTKPTTLVHSGSTTGSITFTFKHSAEDSAHAQAVEFYDVRISESEITDENFFAATFVDASSLTPGTPGTAGEFEIDGLLADTRYYVAIKAANSCLNRSEAVTFCGYTLPGSGPARICE